MCVAIGYGEFDPTLWVQPIVSTVFNGTSWTGPTTIAGVDSLLGVACATASRCVAVGSASNDENLADGVATTFNGTTWSSPAVVLPGVWIDEGNDSRYGYFSTFQSVSCPTASTCVATGLGYDATSSSYQALSATLIGTTWSTPIVLSTRFTARYGAYSVSCASANWCMSGQREDQQVNLLDGSTWGTPLTLSPATPVDTYLRLDGLSCPRTEFCAAALNSDEPSGEDGDSFAHQTTIMVLDGGSWVPSLVRTDPNDNADVTSVNCLSDRFCAVLTHNGTVLFGTK